MNETTIILFILKWTLILALVAIVISLVIAILSAIIGAPFALLKVLYIKMKEHINYYKNVTRRKLIFNVVRVTPYYFEDKEHGIFFHPVPLSKTPSIKQFNRLLRNEPELELDYLFKTLTIKATSKVIGLDKLRFYKKESIAYNRKRSMWGIETESIEGWIILSNISTLSELWSEAKIRDMSPAIIDFLIHHPEPSLIAPLDFWKQYQS